MIDMKPSLTGKMKSIFSSKDFDMSCVHVPMTHHFMFKSNDEIKEYLRENLENPGFIE